MPAERVAMRRVRELLRLKLGAGVPVREVARRIGIAPSTVRETLSRFTAAGLAWPLPETVTDGVLEEALFRPAGTKQGHRRRPEPDWAQVHRELKRKHVTLQLLWDEYIEAHPDGYRYSRFCDLYREWEAKLPVTMRQTHIGGDKLFVDYAGDTVPVIVDRLTGEVRPAQIFVAVLGASSFVYAEATWTQGLTDWVGAHVHAFEAIGGVPIATGRFRKKLLPITPAGVIADTKAALTGKLSHDDLTKYNYVQKLLYAGIIVVGIVIVLSGLSIWKPVQLQYLTALFGGYDVARYVHFVCMAAIVAFLVVHVVLALLVPKSLRAMIIGR